MYVEGVLRQLDGKPGKLGHGFNFWLAECLMCLCEMNKGLHFNSRTAPPTVSVWARESRGSIKVGKAMQVIESWQCVELI